MKIVPSSIVGGLFAAAVMSVASAHQSVIKPPVQPASQPASAAVPITAASKQPMRSAAVAADQNAKEPGNQRPDERVIPQISIPLRSKNSPAPSASAPVGIISDGVARCIATSKTPREREACKRGLAASVPASSK